MKVTQGTVAVLRRNIGCQSNPVIHILLTKDQEREIKRERDCSRYEARGRGLVPQNGSEE